jgi:UDP-N-acetylglucosamine transferase subunit ALG13
MIFVTVGNALQRFERLLQEVESCAAEGLFGSEEVVVQVGSNIVLDMPHCTKVAFLTPHEYRSAMRTASLVIAHCGAGSISQALQAGHVPVVMPRDPKRGEGLEDQSDLMRELEALGKVVGIHGERTMREAVGIARRTARSATNHDDASKLLFIVADIVRDIYGGARK